MKQQTTFLLFLAIFAVAAWNQSLGDSGKTALDRVVTSNTLRCGYGVVEPFIMKDPNSGDMKGAIVEIVEEFGRQAGLKIEWVEEVDWGQIAVALQSKRIDAMCSTIWATPERAKVIGFSRPLFYSTVEAYAKKGDNRFDNNIKAINSPEISIAVGDGDVSSDIARKDFPFAKRITKADLSGEAGLLMDVSAGKADLTFTNAWTFEEYNKANPNNLRKISIPKSLRLFANVIGVDIHELSLLQFIDNGMASVIRDGTVDRVFNKYFGNDSPSIRRANVE